MTDYAIRPMSAADAEPGIELAMRVFDEFVAPGFPPEGIATFRAWADPAAFADRLGRGYVAFAAVRDGRIVGMIEWMPPDHVAMLFVDPVLQGEGIGRQLFEAALQRIRTVHPDLATVRVHASRYAVAFYRRLGFRETGPERQEDGILYTPMRLEVEK